jgi:hypothetical protein
MALSLPAKLNLSVMAARNWYSLSVWPFVGRRIPGDLPNRPTLLPFAFQPLVVCVWNTDVVHEAVHRHCIAVG